jgi:beta-galactosidase
VTDVRVYSNALATELVVNGRSLATATAAECPQRTCVWKGVPLSVGDNEIVAKGRFAEAAVEDRITWRLAASAKDAIRIDSGALVAAPSSSGSGRFGSDAFFEGGAAGSVNAAPEFGRRPEKRTIAGTKDSDSDLVATFREGDFRYRIPVENGRYAVSLTFVEPSAAAGERQFDVIANGVPALVAFDVAATAGAPRYDAALPGVRDVRRVEPAHAGAAKDEKLAVRQRTRGPVGHVIHRDHGRDPAAQRRSTRGHGQELVETRFQRRAVVECYVD